MKAKLKKSPKMAHGGMTSPINNIANPIPYPSLFNINPFGLIAANPTGTKDDEVTSSLEPVDRDIANIEAEKGEVMVKGDLSGLWKIKGKKHSEGGTPLLAKEGSFIFSDNKDMSLSKAERDLFNFKNGGETKKKNTPAKIIQREVDPQTYNKMMTILMDPKAGDIAKQTAALMLQKHQEKIGQVALLQEAKKARAQIPPFAVGPTTLSVDQQDKAKQGAEMMYAALGGFIPKMSNGGPGYTWQGKDEDYFKEVLKNPSKYSQESVETAKSYFKDPASYNSSMAKAYRDKANADPSNSVWSAGASHYEGLTPPDKTGRWAGDYKNSKNPKTGQVNSNWNAMTDYQSPNDYATAIGYTGKVTNNPSSIQKMQQWVMQQYPDIVNKYHGSSQYGLPTAGKPDDGKLGVRWQAIGNDIINPKLSIPFGGPPDIPFVGQPTGANPTQPQGVQPSNPGYNPPVTQDQWQGFHFGMNSAEKLTTAAPFLTALSQKPYYDMLTQRYTPNTRLDRMDANQEATQIQQANSLAQREAAQNLPGMTSQAIGANAQARSTNALDNLYHQTNERNQQIANQESEINLQNKVRDMDFNLGQIQQTYRNNILTQQRRDEQLANGATSSLNNGIAIRQRLDAMGSAATNAALPYVTGQKDTQGNPVYSRDTQGNIHQQMGVPIGFGNNRNPVYNPAFGGTDSTGVAMAGQGAIGRNFNNLLMGQINDALTDKSVEGTKRLYTLLLGLDRTNRPNTKGDTPLENIGQAARSAYAGQ